MLSNNIIRQFLVQVTGLISGFVISVLTTRILGADGRGDFALLLNTSNFLVLLLGMNLSPAIVHVISSNRTPLRYLSVEVPARLSSIRSMVRSSLIFVFVVMA